MTSLEDLISTISGGMHVSQDGYDLKALREYLARTIVLPAFAHSPTTSCHPLPSSRSISSTRTPLSLPSSYFTNASPQPYPSPVCNMSFHSADDVAMASSSQRPNALRRTSSYGFEINNPLTPNSPSGFEGDAFAPVSQASTSQSSDPWARVRQPGASDVKANPWAAFGIQQSNFTYRQPQTHFGDDRHQLAQRAPPTPPEEVDEDEGMDEDMDEADQGMDEEEDEELWSDLWGYLMGRSKESKSGRGDGGKLEGGSMVMWLVRHCDQRRI